MRHKVAVNYYNVNKKVLKMVGWFASAMFEASNALRDFEDGNPTEAKARAYEAQRIFARIFIRAFEEPK